MSEIRYLELLRLAAPEALIVATAFVVLAADLVLFRTFDLQKRAISGAVLSTLGCLLAAGWMLAFPEQANVLSGILVLDASTRITKSALLLLAVGTVLISTETQFTVHVGEFFAMLLLGLSGMMFLVSSDDILVIFLSLELTSLCLYVLTGFNKEDVRSAEAALKYFLFGGVAAAFTLFGLSLLYGISGSTNLGEIAQTARASAGGGSLDPLLVVAMVMVVVGFGFKVAVAPFHLWAPDAYHGAPAPSAAFIASGSKVAGFFVFVRVMVTGFGGLDRVAPSAAAWLGSGWLPLLAVLAVFSMLLGNLAALVQTSVRRLLAYSAIAHAGYILIGIMAQEQAGLASVMFYAFTYALTTLGAFGVVSVIEQSRAGDRLSDFAGLGRSDPVLAACMLIFMLSLAGIPPLAGFFGKFYVFAAALKGPAGGPGVLALVALAVLMSVVSLYYYLKVLKQIYIVESVPEHVAKVGAPVRRTVLALLASMVVLLGCNPELVLKLLLG